MEDEQLGFNGCNGWRLPVRCLACIAMALPDIDLLETDFFLNCVKEGLLYTHVVEVDLNKGPQCELIQKAGAELWLEVEMCNSMANSILRDNQGELTDAGLYSIIRRKIADIFVACFSNIPKVIRRKLCMDAPESQWESVAAAAKLQVHSQRILEEVSRHRLPDMNPDDRACIDKWRAEP